MFSKLKNLQFGALAVGLALAITPAAMAESDPQGMNFSDVAWTEVAPGVEIGPVWGDMTKGPYGMLIRFQPGASLPNHTHPHDYHAVTIQGTWVHGRGDDLETLTPGSYEFQAGEEPHTDLCDGTEECILYLHQDGPQGVTILE